MTTPRSLHRLVVACGALVLATPGAFAQVKTPPPEGSPLALVLSVAGDVQGDTAVTSGSLLTEGQELRLQDGSSLFFSLITSCSEAFVEGPGKLRFEGGALVLDGARLTRSQPAPGCVTADRVVLSTSSQVSSGAIVVRGAASKGRVSPRGGVITASRRRLVWDGPLADGRTVLITLTRGDIPRDILLETEVSGGSFELPDDVALVPGGPYAWSVEPAGLSPGPSLAGSFMVAEDAIATQLAALRERAIDSTSWLRVAFFCEVHMLEADAADAYAQAVARDPGASGAQTRLAELDLP